MREKTKIWLHAALIRAIRTVAQAAIGAIGAATFLGGVDWPLVASTAILAGIVSLLTSVAGLPEINQHNRTDGEGN